MKRIPNWKTWPDQIFACPAGAVVGGTAAAVFGDVIAEGNLLVRILVIWGIIGVAMIPGVFISALLHHLRRPLHRRRLRDLPLVRRAHERLRRLGDAVARNDRPATPDTPPQRTGEASGEIYSRAEGEMLALMFVWCGLVLSVALGEFAWLLVTKTLQGAVLAGAGASLGAVGLVVAGVAGSVVWVMKRTRRR